MQNETLLITSSEFWSYIYPIITLMIGAILTYFFNYFEVKRQENKELYRYEYTLITDILEIMRQEQKEEKMLKLYNEEKRKPNFMKIKDYKLIMELIKKVLDKSDAASEKIDIQKIRRELKDKI